MWLAPLHEAEATVDLWSGHPEAAAASIDACLDLIEGAETSFYTSGIYELGTRAAADIAERAHGDEAVRAAQEARAVALLARLDGLLEVFVGTPPPRAVISRGLCRGELGRLRARREGGGEDGAGADAGERKGGRGTGAGGRMDEGGADAGGGPWAEARAAAEGIGDSYRVAYASWREAEAILGAGGDRGRAGELAASAHAIVAALGARPLAAELEALARRGRLDLAAAASAPAAGAEDGGGGEEDARAAALDRLDLTPREREVLAHLAEGATNRQIAAALFISEKTASVHVSNILGKLGVRNRGEAAARAHRLGVPA